MGIVGLPNAGKSTLFKALTKNPVAIADYPFTTIHPNVGVVAVPDERLNKIAKAVETEKITPTIIEFVDIAGLVKGAHKGEGLGNQFLAQIRNCDAILEIVRIFPAENIEHVEKEINPERDINIIKNEIIMKDLETVEKALEKKEEKQKKEVLEKAKEQLLQEKLISEIKLTEEEIFQLKDLQLLTAKSTLFLFNGPQSKSEELPEYLKDRGITADLKLEEEASELSEPEKRELKMNSRLDQVIIACYNILDLITFYTITGGKEARAWTLKKDSTAPRAGGIVHSDFEEKFIRAEIIPWLKLFESGSWSKAREKGWLKTVGKDYLVQDGDVIEFKI